MANVASDAAAGDQFGYSVAIAGDTVVIGAYEYDDGGSGSGSAYVFLTTDGGATYGQVAKLTAADGAATTTSATPWRSTATPSKLVPTGTTTPAAGSVSSFSGAGPGGLAAGSDLGRDLGSDAATRRSAPRPARRRGLAL